MSNKPSRQQTSDAIRAGLREAFKAIDAKLEDTAAYRGHLVLDHMPEHKLNHITTSMTRTCISYCQKHPDIKLGSNSIDKLAFLLGRMCLRNLRRMRAAERKRRGDRSGSQLYTVIDNDLGFNNFRGYLKPLAAELLKMHGYT